MKTVLLLHPFHRLKNIFMSLLKIALSFSLIWNLILSTKFLLTKINKPFLMIPDSHGDQMATFSLSISKLKTEENALQEIKWWIPLSVHLKAMLIQKDLSNQSHKKVEKIWDQQLLGNRVAVLLQALMNYKDIKELFFGKRMD